MAASDAGPELHVAWKPDPFILDCGDASNLGAPEEALINLFASESRLTALTLPRWCFTDVPERVSAVPPCACWNLDASALSGFYNSKPLETYSNL